MDDLKCMNTTKTVSILFYKGEATFGEKLIRWWTKSPYSHCEFLRSDGLCHANDRFSRQSRFAYFEINPDDWDFLTIKLPSEIVDQVEKRQFSKVGTSYDWRGIIFSQVFKFGWHSQRHWFCSKSNADDLIYAYNMMLSSQEDSYQPYIHSLVELALSPPCMYSPSSLYATLQKIESH